MLDALKMMNSVRVGDTVSLSELDNIYDILIIVEFQDIDKDSENGIVRYVGERDTEEHISWINKTGLSLAFVYNDSAEVGVDYDE